MFQTRKTSDEIKARLKDNQWEIGELFPLEGFFPAKTSLPHLHLTMQIGGTCYMHVKNKNNIPSEINSAWQPLGELSLSIKSEVWDIMAFLTQ